MEVLALLCGLAWPTQRGLAAGAAGASVSFQHVVCRDSRWRGRESRPGRGLLPEEAGRMRVAGRLVLASAWSCVK